MFVKIWDGTESTFRLVSAGANAVDEGLYDLFIRNLCWVKVLLPYVSLITPVLWM